MVVAWSFVLVVLNVCGYLLVVCFCMFIVSVFGYLFYICVFVVWFVVGLRAIVSYAVIVGFRIVVLVLVFTCGCVI